ncbi:helix-turn-helix domain-containing protein [Ligilactobacillus murinus]|uniref:Helix-turn-helix domain-containing protein n=1 Tax=Ligilactobacillus murinus TaxID=1622 RepID=A0AAE6WH61_9LACO|nr:helix-turn-helix domain-containing protein [Ligilactobacillus murinus]MCR1896054.1 helix-turn-helix domain-containing protein [Ligilactobacillus murinus]NEF83326.1 helix-turn-helix domain-containing protein [Ligilactobacillus murinus]NEF85500.1 helix-turn-helix domain-containing protein [Ligilactobacillus murinus]NEF87917.1 helix-turn-helix domain-containing protein [Ligilactobacillus murinus]NEF90154.1 helix-turn-helix domain-containing protein [Ligilactobacillus murinus]
MANLTFNVAGVSVSVNTADAELIRELQRFNSNLEMVQVLFNNQSANGGNIKETAKSWNVSESTVNKWIKQGLPVVELDGMNKYIVTRSLLDWLRSNEESKQ